MTVSGIVVHNESGSVQVTSDYSNMFLDRIESHNISFNSKPFNITNKIDEIVCIKLSQTASNPTILSNQFIANDGIAGYGYIGGVEAYIFKDKPVQPMFSGDVGMEVYTSDGVPAYNTNSKPLRVIGKVTASNDQVSIALPHSNIGVVMINPKITAVTDGGGTSYRDLFYLSGFVQAGSLVFTSAKRGWINTNNPAPTQDTIPEARFLLVDLTGY